MRDQSLAALRRTSFGRLPSSQPSMALDASTLLHRRLLEKIDSYEREARRLQLRGQADAAAVLEKAAMRLRRVLRAEPESAAARFT